MNFQRTPLADLVLQNASGQKLTFEDVREHINEAVRELERMLTYTPCVNIIQYGAVPYDASDPTTIQTTDAAFQAAVADAKANDVAIYVPSGAWAYNSLTLDWNGAAIFGDGNQSRLVACEAGKGAILIRKAGGANIRNVTVKDLKITSKLYYDDRVSGTAVGSFVDPATNFPFMNDTDVPYEVNGSKNPYLRGYTENGTYKKGFYRLSDELESSIPHYGIRTRTLSHSTIENVSCEGFLIGLGMARTYYMNWAGIALAANKFGIFADALNVPTTLNSINIQRNVYPVVFMGADSGYLVEGWDFDTNRNNVTGNLAWYGGTVEQNMFAGLIIDGYFHHLSFHDINFEENYYNDQSGAKHYDVTIGRISGQNPRGVFFNQCRFRRAEDSEAVFSSGATSLVLTNCGFASYNYVCTENTYYVELKGYTTWQTPLKALFETTWDHDNAKLSRWCCNRGVPLRNITLEGADVKVVGKTALVQERSDSTDQDNYYYASEMKSQTIFEARNQYVVDPLIVGSSSLANKLNTAGALVIDFGNMISYCSSQFVVIDSGSAASSDVVQIMLPAKINRNDSGSYSMVAPVAALGLSEPVYVRSNEYAEGLTLHKVSDDTALTVADIPDGTRFSFVMPLIGTASASNTNIPDQPTIDGTVTLSPTFTQDLPSSYTVDEGDDVVRTIQAENYTSITWWWRQDSSSSWQQITADNDQLTSTTVDADTAYNGRQYKAVLTGSTGETVDSTIMTLTVNAATGNGGTGSGSDLYGENAGGGEIKAQQVLLDLPATPESEWEPQGSSTMDSWDPQGEYVHFIGEALIPISENYSADWETVAMPVWFDWDASRFSSGVIVRLEQDGATSSVTLGLLSTEGGIRTWGGKAVYSASAQKFIDAGFVEGQPVKLHIKGTNGVPYVARHGFGKLYKKATGRPTVVLTFDDGRPAILKTYLAEMVARNLPFTIFPPWQNLIDNPNNDGFMADDEIAAAIATGLCDVQIDGSRDDSLITSSRFASPQDWVDELEEGAQWAQDKGFNQDVRHFCYHRGVYGAGSTSYTSYQRFDQFNSQGNTIGSTSIKLPRDAGGSTGDVGKVCAGMYLVGRNFTPDTKITAVDTSDSASITLTIDKPMTGDIADASGTSTRILTAVYVWGGNGSYNAILELDQQGNTVGSNTFKASLTANGTYDVSKIKVGEKMIGDNFEVDTTITNVDVATGEITVDKALIADATGGIASTCWVWSENAAKYNTFPEAAYNAGFRIGRTTKTKTRTLYTHLGLGGVGLVAPAGGLAGNDDGNLARVKQYVADTIELGSTAFLYTHSIGGQGSLIDIGHDSFMDIINYLAEERNAGRIDILTAQQLWERDGIGNGES